MRIESDVKLDFKDVLLRPKRSTLGSRANVDLNRLYSFRHARLEMPVVPVIAANMDTVGTFEMARALAKHKILTAIHKHYPVEELAAFFGPEGDGPHRYAFYSLGILDNDLQKFDQVWGRTGGGTPSRSASRTISAIRLPR